MSFLELQHLVKRFGSTTVVDDFCLGIEEGEFVSFLGGSGCGKTTTLRMIAGFESPTAGSIGVSGTDLTGVPSNRRGVGMVFQHYALFPNMTVGRNIAFGLKVRGRSASEMRARVKEMLALIHMEEFEERYPHQLSGGQQQRVALARALAPGPRILLLDEPLSALDALIRTRLREEIRAIQSRMGITTVYVTHDQEEALSLSDRVVVMRGGRIEQVGAPAEIYNRPANAFVASFIGTLNVLDGEVLEAATGHIRVQGQDVWAPPPLPPGASVRLSLRPERLSLEPHPLDENHLRCTLLRASFLGSVVRITLGLGERELVLDAFNTPRLVLPPPGTDVTVAFPREACLVLEAQGLNGSIRMAAGPTFALATQTPGLATHS